MRKLTWAGATDVGRRRTDNEDAFIVDPDIGLYVVCDGMGGHASGEVASAMTTEEMHAFVVARLDGDNSLPYKGEPDASLGELILSNAIQHANDKVFVAGMRDPSLEGMGTTVVALSEYEDHFILAHVGDSRIYRLRDGELSQVTRDHSLLNHRIDLGELRTQEEIDNFKHGNVIVRAIGLKDYVRVETAIHERVPGDVFLLCSDGLSDMVDDWSIENVLEANRDDLDEAVSILIRMANERGGKDNISVVVVRVDDSGAEAWDDEMRWDEPQVSRETDTAEFPAVAREDSTEPRQRAITDAQYEAASPSGQQAYRDFADGSQSEAATSPHTPVFGWDDEDDVGPWDDEEEDTVHNLKPSFPPQGHADDYTRRTQTTEELPSVPLDDDFDR